MAVAVSGVSHLPAILVSRLPWSAFCTTVHVYWSISKDENEVAFHICVWLVENGWRQELLITQCSILLYFGPCAYFRQCNKSHTLQTICGGCFYTSRLLLRRLRRPRNVHQWRSSEHLSLTLPSWMPFRRTWAGGSKRYRRCHAFFLCLIICVMCHCNLNRVIVSR